VKVSDQILLIRHGETEWSKSGQHTGTTDIELTEVGRAAAKALHERLADREFELVLTSPLRRARETCELAGFGDRAEVDDDLRELDYGEYEGLTTPEIRETRPGWEVWSHGSPGGETVDQAGERVDRVIERALAADGDTALFAHGHLLRIFGARWIEQPASFGGRLGLSTAALCVLGFERERRIIRLWNQA
jgi:broad specificity phosphatase PhoE